MARKRKTTCGPPCEKLKKMKDGRMFAAHLRFLEIPVPDVGVDSIVDAYIAAGYSGKKPGAYGAAAKLHSSANMQAAMDWHRDQDARRYQASRDRQLQRLNALAEHATMDLFATVDQKGEISLKPWSERTPEELRAVGALRMGPHGVEIKVRDPLGAERLLAELGGWKKPEQTLDISEITAELFTDPGQAATDAIQALADGQDAVAVMAGYRKAKAQ